MKIISLVLITFGAAIYWLNAPQTNAGSAPLCQSVTPIVPPSLDQHFMLQTNDGGETWSSLDKSFPASFKQIAAVLPQDNALYISMLDGQLYHQNKSLVAAWESDKIIEQDNGIYHLSAGKMGLYACIQDQGLWRKKQGENNWVFLSKPLKDKNLHDAIETEAGQLLISCASGIYKSDDQGATWKQVFADGWASSLIESAGAIMASSETGLIRSVDGGDSWTCLVKDFGAVYRLSAIEGGFAAVRSAAPNEKNPQRTIISTNKGDTWQRLNEGSALGGNAPWNQSESYSQSCTIGGLLRPSQTIQDIVQAGKQLFCTHQYGVSRSNDMGKTWELLLSYTPAEKNEFRFELVAKGATVFVAKVWGGC